MSSHDVFRHRFGPSVNDALDGYVVAEAKLPDLNAVKEALAETLEKLIVGAGMRPLSQNTDTTGQVEIKLARPAE